MQRLVPVLLVIWVAAGVGVAAYLYSRSEPGLPVIGELPAFSLTERGGRPVGLGDLRGRVWVAGFIFTRCAGTCPRMISAMSELQEKTASRPEVTLICISVDPEYDTPERLREYAELAGADPKRWLFLTGDREEIYALARQHFRLSVGGPGSQEEPILHSSMLALVDGGGRIRGYYDGTDAEATARLLRDIARLKRERRS